MILCALHVAHALIADAAPAQRDAVIGHQNDNVGRRVSNFLREGQSVSVRQSERNKNLLAGLAGKDRLGVGEAVGGLQIAVAEGAVLKGKIAVSSGESKADRRTVRRCGGERGLAVVTEDE